MKQNEFEQNKQLLKNLIENDNDLKPLSKWLEKINIFEILQSGKTEIKHSKVLAWLMNVDGNHQLGDAFIREFIKKVIKNNPEKDYDIFDWSFIDCSSQIVKTEEDNIDITVRFEAGDSKYILVVENKTKTTEHDAGQTKKKQTTSYKEKIQKKYPDYEKLFVYLTPSGDSSADDAWCLLSYDNVVEIIETVITGKTLLPQVGLIIENYCELIKKDVIRRDSELFNECNSIYKKHSQALELLYAYSRNRQTKEKNKDVELLNLCNRVYSLYEEELELIYKNRPDEISELVNEIEEWIVKQQDLEKTESSGKTYVTFTSKTLDELIPRLSISSSSWGTTNTYQFLFYTADYKNNKKIKLAIELGGDNLTEEISAIHKKIIDGTNPRIKTIPYKYKVIRSETNIDFNNKNAGLFKAKKCVESWVAEIKNAIEAK